MCTSIVLFSVSMSSEAIENNINVKDLSKSENLKLIQKSIKGKVVDESGMPLPGASVLVKGTTTGTMTDFDGEFFLDVPEGKVTLVVSYIGYQKQEVSVTGTGNLNIVLKESNETLDEVIITGVFDKRTAMESSVAISVLKEGLIERQVPVSATDLLKNVPGVYVNSSAGEIKNTIVSRGLGGYFYVSVQEDGLPVTSAKYNNYGPDYFLRSDITLSKLEAVRGGTASILGNNAPGGIYNYVSKVGGHEFGAEVQAKFGLEGDGKNPYYRTDINVGGPLVKGGSITYNIGGFWREADGARYPGYEMNKGGQLKANLYMPFNNGGLKVYAKYLNDRNSSFEFLPTVDFDNPRMAPGVTQTSSVLIPSVISRYEQNQSGVFSTFDSEDLIHSTDFSIGANLDYELDNGWNFKNNFRYSDKGSNWNQTSIPTPIATTGQVIPGSGAAVLYGSLGLFDNQGLNVTPFGNVIFRDQASGQELMQVRFSASATGLSFDHVSGELAGEYAPNSLLFNPLTVFDNNVSEVIDQLMITKEFENMSFTAGAYFSTSNVDRLSSSGGIAFPQLTSPIPSLTTISYLDPYGNEFQLTNPDGVVGGSGFIAPTSFFNLKQTQLAGFFGQNWKITPDLNFDWGVRYEKDWVDGENIVTPQYPRPKSDTGGTDGNPLTLYDNYLVGDASTFAYDESITAFSYSLGLNYKFSDEFAIFGRFSQGELPADLSQFLSIDSDGSQGLLAPKPQRVQQIEGGIKMNREKYSLFLTPFYTLLDNIYVQSIGRDDAGDIYYTPVLYNKNEAYGIELEGNVALHKNINLRSVFTYQHRAPIIAQTYDTGAPGEADDVIIDLTEGNDGASTLNFRISPSYNIGKFYSTVDWSFVGDRPANTIKAFELPAYHQFDLSMGYEFSKMFRLQFNMNNIFNSIGVNAFMPPGTDPTSLNPEAFTREQLLANPNAVYYTQSIPPRAYFLTASFKF
ncbi:TonB-dependent receptor [Aestuariibaculum sp. M13]|uniref:TonB-dependent receptor n=1 Tax=Aestuariibaculum sp. M13 TaxID=2967132 RepID=UPI002159F5B3|nr:TonB-dependent receptor [Aestuariibaculum sp. M13]MCR8667867.1 TonB-dependent receptor [Aestuariibaculum sp. M13]